MGLVLEAYFVERLEGHLFAPVGGDAADGQRELYVLKDRLMRDQVVGLKDKADGMVSVGVPVAVFVFFGRNAVDNQVAAVIAVQSADDIEKGGLSGAAGPQDRHELVVPQIQGDIVERGLLKTAGDVFLIDVLKLEHRKPHCGAQCAAGKCCLTVSAYGSVVRRGRRGSRPRQTCKNSLYFPSMCLYNDTKCLAYPTEGTK